MTTLRALRAAVVAVLIHLSLVPVDALADSVQVISPIAIVREGPGNDFKSLGKLNKGRKLTVVDREGDWIKVHLANRVTGWVANSDVSTVVAAAVRGSGSSSAFIINFDVSEESPFVDSTRVLVTQVDNDLLRIHFERPLYRRIVQMGMMGFGGFDWSPGAIHIYSGIRSTTSSFSAKFSKAAIARDNTLGLIMDSGSVAISSRLRGWKVESDPSYPLIFRVAKGVGYKHIAGRGAVTSPTGSVVALGKSDTVTKWVRLLSSADADDREAAVEALSWMGDKSAVPALIKALKDKEPRIRRGAAEALGVIGDQPSKEDLEQARSDPDAWTAETVAWSLAQPFK